MHIKDKLETFNNDLLPFRHKGKVHTRRGRQRRIQIKTNEEDTKEVPGQSHNQEEQVKTHLELMVMNTIFGRKTQEVRTFDKDFTH